MAGDDLFDDELEHIRAKKLEELKGRVQSADIKPRLIEIGDATFHSSLKQYSCLLIDFWAPWCGPCRRVGPAVESLAAEFSGQMAFAKCNVDENPATARSLGISAIPALMFFMQGKLVDRLVGAYPREAIRERILSLLR
jgi:thioredoxin 1